MASLAPIPVTVYVVEARRNFESVVVGVHTELTVDLRASEGWSKDDLEWRLYRRRRWTRLLPHDSPEPHVVTAWEIELQPVVTGEVVELVGDGSGQPLPPFDATVERVAGPDDTAANGG